MMELSQTKYSSAVRRQSVAIRQVPRKAVPSQSAKTVLVLPQSIARSIRPPSWRPSEVHVRGRDHDLAALDPEDQVSGLVHRLEDARDLARAGPGRHDLAQ